MKKLLTGLLIIILIATLSCKKAEEGKKPSTEEAAISKTEEKAEETKSTLESSKEAEKTSEKVTAIDFQILEEWLPEREGWTKSNVKGQQFSYGEGKTSVAEADYTSGETSVYLQILDSARISWTMGQFLQMVQMGFSAKDDTHYVKTIKVSNYPALEEYNYQRREGQLQVLIKDRYLITVRGKNLDNTDILHDFFSALDLKKFD